MMHVVFEQWRQTGRAMPATDHDAQVQLFAAKQQAGHTGTLFVVLIQIQLTLGHGSS
jgi:hypothetical protein